MIKYVSFHAKTLLARARIVRKKSKKIVLGYSLEILCKAYAHTLFYNMRNHQKIRNIVSIMALTNQVKSRSYKKSSPALKYVNFFVLGLVCVVIITLSTSIFFYYQTITNNSAIKDLQIKHTELIKEYDSAINTVNILRNYNDELLHNYELLKSSYEELQDYYEELQIDLQNLQNEKIKLENNYLKVLEEKNSLEKELNNIENFENINVLETDKLLVIQPKKNVTLSYDTTFAGYIQINISASKDIIIWIGSSITDELYYARLPPSFPNTITQGSFVVPTCCTTHIFVINPNENTEVEVELSITYTY